MHIRSWRLQPQAAVLMPRRFTHGQDVTDGTQSGYVGLFVGWIGHGQVDINDILSRQAGHRGRTDMLDGQRPRAHCPANACSEFGKTIWPLSVVDNNLDRLDRRRPVDPWIVIGVRIVMTNDVGDANHDIDATYRISRRNPSGCVASAGSLARQEVIDLVSLDSGFRLVVRSTASRGLPAEPPTSGGEVAARVHVSVSPCPAARVHRGGVRSGSDFPHGDPFVRFSVYVYGQATDHFLSQVRGIAPGRFTPICRCRASLLGCRDRRARPVQGTVRGGPDYRQLCALRTWLWWRW